MSKSLEDKIRQLYVDVKSYADIPIITASSPVTGAVMASLLAHASGHSIQPADIRKADEAAHKLCFGKLRAQNHHIQALSRKYPKRRGWDRVNDMTSMRQPGGQVADRIARHVPNSRFTSRPDDRGRQRNLILRAAAKHVRECVMAACKQRVRYHPWVTIRDDPDLLGTNIVMWPNLRFCVVAQPPSKLHWNNNRQLHRRDGLAVRYSDGFGAAFVLGINVDRKYVDDPKLLTAKVIQRTANVETRRALIELMGPERYLVEAKAALIDAGQDRLGKQQRLWNIIRPNWGNAPHEGLNMLETVNSTPEPDGSYKTYYLTVPGNVRSRNHALNWMASSQEHVQFRIET